jgi:threonine dehydratase
LLNFLEGLGSDYNISLFHYRNHGSAFGRVLVGIERSSIGRQALSSRLRSIGYRFWEESANPARDLFL